MKKVVFILLLSSFYALTGQAQDTIILKNTVQVIGYIQSVDTTTLYYYTDIAQKDSLYELALQEINEINYQPSITTAQPSIAIQPLEEKIHWKNRKRNLLTAKILGNSVIGGIAYSRIVGGGEGYFLNIEGGVGFAPYGTSIFQSFSIASGRGEHYFEATMNQTFTWGENWADKFGIYALSPTVGYRMQLKKGFVFRVYGGPAVLLHNKVVNNWGGEGSFPTILPCIGFDIGYSF